MSVVWPKWTIEAVPFALQESGYTGCSPGNASDMNVQGTGITGTRITDTTGIVRQIIHGLLSLVRPESHKTVGLQCRNPFEG